ncbi:asparagine--tRNA ligase, partial [Stenotrophomonas sp.]|uniref:asparagine--tRNA ligase n=1 Tax=Stenotrophomonas sp. TaxID=69392 RepID=UPI00333F3BB5
MTVVSVEHALAGKIPEGGEATVRGWVRTVRGSAALAFVNVTDGSCFAPIQVVANDTLANFDDIKSLTPGCSVIARGTLVKSQGKGQSFEIQASDIEIVGLVEDPLTYPIQPKPMSPEFLREVAHLRPRTNLFGAVTRIRNCLAQAVHRFFHQNGFNWISTPIVTTSDAEGAGQMFRVSTLDMANLPRNEKGEVDFSRDFFGKETFLTVSGQLNVEAYCLALSKVYTFGPTFRAENSNTTRHLAEFWMIEPEIAFADLAEDARLAEQFLKYLFRAVLDERGDDLAFLAERVDKNAISKLEGFINAPFEQIDYTEAVKLLQNSGKKFDFPVEWGLDLQTEHERWLTEELIGRPVVVTNYP